MPSDGTPDVASSAAGSGRLKPSVFTIPAHRAFGDALVAGLIRRHGRGPLDLARGLLLLPSARSVRTLRDAFVRASAPGLVLPRLVVLGDAELDEAVGVPLDDLDADPLPPAIAPLARRMRLARILGERLVPPVTPAEAVRLAGPLGAALDAMSVEEVPARALNDLEVAPELQAHWQRSLAMFATLAADWPGRLAADGLSAAADRRNRQLDRVACAWADRPPGGWVVAAGVQTSAPAVARLLRTVADLPAGDVVFVGLDLAMADEEWDWLGEHRQGESHPQYEARRLLDRMGVARAEVRTWPHAGGADANERRGRLIASAFAPAPFTGGWFERVPAQARLNGVTVIECDNSAEEAQAIAIRLRGALETPGRRAALVTPDRALARRVAAHLRRWDVEVDDTAGTPLSRTPPGVFLGELAASVADRFAPVGLMALLKHPLASGGLARLDWLDGVRALDVRMRGVRPAAGLAGIAARLAEGKPLDERADEVWRIARAALEPLSPRGASPAGEFVAAMRGAAEALAGEALWSAPAGRMAADWWDEVEVDAALLGRIAPDEWPSILASLLEGRAVRPPQGGHPRVTILGLIEARLSHADLMIAGGLNEGVWPALPAPDPWLAPRIRRELDLPSGERRIGLAAHDLVNLLGAPEVVLTRSRRREGAPTVASRFWLRLSAMSGGLGEDGDTRPLALALDASAGADLAARPRPSPPADRRPDQLSVSSVDVLATDPYAFYAARVLRLRLLAELEEEPGPQWKGTHVHRILDDWHKHDGGRPDALIARARDFLAGEAEHPLLRALWEPRLLRHLDWIAGRLAADLEDGVTVDGTELEYKLTYGGVTLSGRIDRIDRTADGTLTVIDYKTGGAPSAAAVRAGYALQLGLNGLLLEHTLPGETVAGFAYWTFRRKGEDWGQVIPLVDKDERYKRLRPDAMIPHARAAFQSLVDRYLLGSDPFVAKLRPDALRGGDYDQLMRLDEWWGR